MLLFFKASKRESVSSSSAPSILSNVSCVVLLLPELFVVLLEFVVEFVELLTTDKRSPLPTTLFKFSLKSFAIIVICVLLLLAGERMTGGFFRYRYHIAQIRQGCFAFIQCQCRRNGRQYKAGKWSCASSPSVSWAMPLTCGLLIMKSVPSVLIVLHYIGVFSKVPVEYWPHTKVQERYQLVQTH